jgi:hypothetical protein
MGECGCDQGKEDAGATLLPGGFDQDSMLVAVDVKEAGDREGERAEGPQ